MSNQWLIMIPYLKEKGKWGGGGVAATPENGEQSVQARSAKPSTATENRTPLRGDKVTDGLSWKINPAGLHRRTSKKPKRGVRSPPRPYRPPGRTCAFAHARPALRVVLCVLRVLCDFQNTLAVLRALARRPSLCLSVFSVVSVFFVICGSRGRFGASHLHAPFWQSFFVPLCGPLCSL